MDEVLATKSRARRITWQDAEAIADLVTDSLTETEACLNIGISNVRQWFRFKERAKHKPQFDALLTRLRGNKLHGCIKAIRNAGDEREINLPNGKTYTKTGDWRAKAWLAERVLAPERLGDRQQPTNQTNVIMGDDVAARVIALFNQSKQRQVGSITNPREDKLLDAPKTIDNIEQK